MIVTNTKSDNEKKTTISFNYSNELIHKLDSFAQDICSKLDTLCDSQLQTEKQNKSDDFYHRQVLYEELRQQNINELKQQQINDDLKKHMPKINQSTDLVYNYFQKKLNDQNSKLLKYLDKHTQTVEQSYTRQSQRIKTKSNQNKIAVQKIQNNAQQLSTKQDVETQTDFEYDLSNITIQNQIETKTSDIYIPIWDRVKYIKESQQQSLNQKIQQKKDQEDQYIKSLQFQPQLATPNKKKIINEQDAQSFFESQTKWQEKIKQRSIHKSFCDDAPEFSFKPKILQKSFILSEKKMNDQNKSIYERNLDKKEETQSKIQQFKCEEHTFRPHLTHSFQAKFNQTSQSKSPLVQKIMTQRSKLV